MSVSRRAAGWGRRAATTLALLACALAAGASGPRYVTGPPYFSNSGTIIGWRQTTLLYSTDPGDLSVSVPHAQADALAAAAAGVWNIPVARITVAQGGTLAEHVSSQNVYLDSAGMEYPADVQSANAAAIPLAIVYDTDGSVTDTLLGSGASEPSSCGQNAVTETVDSFDPAGYILHAIIVVNGRCTGPSTQQQLQLQYQLERIFGRVLGLAWSQVNDNVFTGNPVATFNQALHWPIMHPIDIVCGLYTYQCLPNPFQLRPDDVASLVAVYPINQGAPVPAGKQVSLSAAATLQGTISFPSGQGMAGVNALVREGSPSTGLMDSWYTASSVSGWRFRQSNGPPWVSPDTSATGSLGQLDVGQLGQYSIASLPISDASNSETVTASLEPVNPLYHGSYSLGPYSPGVVSPAGSLPPVQSVRTEPFAGYELSFTLADAPVACGEGTDGTASAPMQAPASGWWTNLICGYGHVSYVGLDVRPNRSFTVEMTALDAQGVPTTDKLMPVIALFSPSDGANSPSLGTTPTAFQALGIGTTTISASTGQLSRIRIGLADQRGDGRPDYSYQARLFYADQVTPSVVAIAGGQVTISGMGFRVGNAVTINGVAASVTSWTANQIVLTTPTQSQAQATSGMPVDIVVRDRTTGATATLSSALTYDPASELPDSLGLVSAPSGTLYVGDPASVPFAVRVLGPDGVTPVEAAAVVFSFTSGTVQWTACAAVSCTVLTDASGVAQTGLSATAAGAVSLQAVSGALVQTASVTALPRASSMQVLSAPTGALNVTLVAATPFSVRVFGPDGTTGLAGRLITFTVPVGGAVYTGCETSTCSVVTDGSGTASVSVVPTAIGPVTLRAADDTTAQTASFTGASNTDSFLVRDTPSASVAVNQWAGHLDVTLLHADGTTPDGLETITFSAPAGVVFSLCGLNVCPVSTNNAGEAGTDMMSSQVGVVVIHVAFGAVVRQVTINVNPAAQQHIVILSAPSGELPVGVVAATPFSAQLIDVDGVTPVLNAQMSMAGTSGGVTLSTCGFSGCTVVADGNGVFSTQVTPTKLGQITLSAVSGQLTANTSFIGTGQLPSMRVVSQPASGTLVGTQVQFVIQLLAMDGITPVVGTRVTFSVVAGSLTLPQCGFAQCNLESDQNGMVNIAGVPTQPGLMQLEADQGALRQTMSFVALANGDVLRLVSAPATGSIVGSLAAPPFALQVLQPDGITARANTGVTLSVTAGSASFVGCALTAPCVVETDANGLVSVAVTPLAAGTIVLHAIEGGGTLSTSFAAIGLPDRLTVSTAPPLTALVGSVVSLVVEDLLADGMTPAVGKTVSFVVNAGGVTLGGCSGVPCSVLTDSAGQATITLTGISAGAVSLTASDTSASVMANYTLLPKGNSIALVSSPGISLRAGATAPTPFAVEVLGQNGAPAVGVAVTFRLSGQGAGTVQFGACPSPCVVQTDTTGRASTPVMGLAPGAAMLVADAQATDGSSADATLSVPLQIVSATLSVNPLEPVTYLGEGTTLSFLLHAIATDEPNVGSGQPMAWSGSTGFTVSAGSSLTDALGETSMTAQAGPLAAGATEEVTACAWSIVCTQFQVLSIAAESWTIGVISGGQQAATVGQAYAPLVVRIGDGAGHGVGGVPVTVFETVTAVTAACPTRGRCPAAPILASKETVTTSDAGGSVTLVPLGVNGVAAETEIVLAAGPEGFATVTLTSQP